MKAKKSLGYPTSCNGNHTQTINILKDRAGTEKNIVVALRSIILLRRKNIFKEEEILFTVPIGNTFGVLVDHEHIIVNFFLHILSRRDWRGPWAVRRSELGEGTVRALYRGYKK